MDPDAKKITTTVCEDASGCLDACLDVIRHCVDQLSEKQVWWRPHESMNSVGNLLLHLRGNVRQWLVTGIGNLPDDRDRPQEFAERQRIPKNELVSELQRTVDEAKQTLASMTPDELLQPRTIQGFEVTASGAIFDSVPHFKGHTQEIVCLTRWQLGKAYRFRWEPQTPEEGASAWPE